MSAAVNSHQAASHATDAWDSILKALGGRQSGTLATPELTSLAHSALYAIEDLREALKRDIEKGGA